MAPLLKGALGRQDLTVAQAGTVTAEVSQHDRRLANATSSRGQEMRGHGRG